MSGISEPVYQQLMKTGRLQESSHVRAYDATPTRGQSTRATIAAAREWLLSQHGEPASDDPERK